MDNGQNANFPDFLGIGAMRCGTSWLYKVLKSHREVYVPGQVKEIHYFDHNYDRGLAWYQAFFAIEQDQSPYKVKGEITPRYLYEKDVPARVREQIPDARFIVLLRNPVNRAYSHFRNAFFKGTAKCKTFSGYLQENPAAFERGLYAEQLTRWLDYFDQDRFLVLIFDEVMQNPQAAMASISAFLGVDPNGFDESLLAKKVNPSNAPRLRGLYRLGIKLRRYLRHADFHWAGTVVEQVGSRLFRFLGDSKKDLPPLQETDKQDLLHAYAQDISRLEKLLHRDLSVWRQQ